MAISKFRGEHYYLSNMYPLENPIETFDGAHVSTSEAAYCAERFVLPEDRALVHSAKDGFKAKEFTKELQRDGAPIDPQWELGKLVVMRIYVAKKFEGNPELAAKLIATGDEEIVEGNTWDDRFWGESPMGSGNGLNWLGRILMDTRRGLMEENKQHKQAA